MNSQGYGKPNMAAYFFLVLQLTTFFLWWVNTFPYWKFSDTIMAKKLLEHVFPSWRICFTICSDQGIHFTGQIIYCCCSVAQSCLTLSNPMECHTPPGFPVLHHLLQFAHSYPLSQRHHPTILSSVIPFSSCLRYFPASGSFLMSRLFTSGGQSIGASASALVLIQDLNNISNIQDWFPLVFTGLISFLSKGLSSVFSNTTVQKYQCSAFFMVQISHIYVTTGKTIALTRQIFVSKVMSLLFNILSKFVIAFLPREQVSSNFMAAVTICSDFGSQENKVCHCFHCPCLFAMKWWDQIPWS